MFLDTISRKELIKDLPVYSVPVLACGKFNKMEDVIKYLRDSNYISDSHRDNLVNEAVKLNLDSDRILRETDASRLMEGLYIKVEENGCVVDRMKYVRYSFLQTVDTSETHWLDRPIVPNKLDKPIDELSSEEELNYYLKYVREALEKIHVDIEHFAEAEKLTAHANSIKVRFEK